MKLNIDSDRYQFICDRVRDVLPYWYGLKFVEEYEDAVVATCDPPNSNMSDGKFLIPQIVFEKENIDCENYIENYGSFDKSLPEKYLVRPLKCFYMSAN